MQFYSYQTAAAQTAIYPPAFRVVYPLLGLLGEAGEVANKVKKVFRDENGDMSDEKRRELSKELGDVLWYLAALATDLDLRLDAIAEENIEKLMDRKERGVIGGSGDSR